VGKNRVKIRFKEASTPGGEVVAGLMLWAVLFGSKFVVLEVVGLVLAGGENGSGIGMRASTPIDSRQLLMSRVVAVAAASRRVRTPSFCRTAETW
jgi:hypothetical protein